MNKLTPKQERRFDKKDLDKWGLDYVDVKDIKQFLADELSKQRKEIIKELKKKFVGGIPEEWALKNAIIIIKGMK